MNLAYVHKLANNNNGIKYLLVRQDVFDTTVDAKRLKTKRFQRNGSCIFDKDYKKNQPKKFWVDKGTEFAGQLEKLSKLKEYNFPLQ